MVSEGARGQDVDEKWSKEKLGTGGKRMRREQTEDVLVQGTKQKPQVFVIVGPTASGKTKLGIEVAKRHNGEIVSADSMQIYRGMDIGTAKPSKEEMEGVVHHMLDVVDPTESYSVAEYVTQASAVVEDILSRGKLPIVVGGTGLYIDSLLKNRPFAPVTENKPLRQGLEQEICQKGGAALLERLRELDPETAERLFPNDHKRIVRALEIVMTTGKTQGFYDRESRDLPPRFTSLTLGLNFEDREELRQGIYKRVDLMMEMGLFEEVRRFSHLPRDATAMQAIGYKELLGAISGQQSVEEAVDLLKIRSRQYAKRQITWFKNKSDLRWHYWEKIPNFQNALQVSTDYLVEFEVI